MGERVSVRSVVCLLFLLPASVRSEPFSFKLINGEPVPPGEMEQMVRIVNPARGSGCSATLVGLQALITAAHCGESGDVVSFVLRGVRYFATLNQSPFFRSGRHDISVGKITPPLPSDAKLASVSSIGRAANGLAITVAGFGCFLRNGMRAFDRQLRAGAATILGLNGRDIGFGGANAAILCSGDSGGAAFSSANGKDELLAVNSRGNSRFSIDTRLDTQQSHDVMREIAQANGIDICGVTKTCDGSPSAAPGAPAPQPGAPGSTAPAPPPSVAGNGPVSPAPPPGSPGTGSPAPAPAAPERPIAQQPPGSSPAPAPIFVPPQGFGGGGSHGCAPSGRVGAFGGQGQVIRVGRSVVLR